MPMPAGPGYVDSPSMSASSSPASATASRQASTVSDNGSGPPPGLDVPSGSSLGLKIVRAMASQLQGEFSIADGAPGAVCVLTYPAHNRA